MTSRNNLCRLWPSLKRWGLSARARGKQVALIGGMALLSASCSKPAVQSDLFSNCQRLALVDSATHQSIIGAEDFASDIDNGMLYFSAYDRRKAEKMARKRGQQAPASGGLYALPLAALKQAFEQGKPSIAVSPLISATVFANGLRPHGINLDRQNGTLNFINRGYVQERGRWRLSVTIETIALNGGAQHLPSQVTHCAANDLAGVGGVQLVSIDHRHCGLRGRLAEVFNLANSGVMDHAGMVLDDVRFANGVVMQEHGQFFLAATRGNEIRQFQYGGSSSARLINRFSVPGGPDNLTLIGEGPHAGSVLAALHTNLLRMGLHRRMGIGHAPSRVVAIDPQKSEAATLLFEDKTGRLFSGASVAMLHEGLLILGSATDAGIVLCTRPDEPAREAVQ